ncbi:fungal-specific transcription factor domain-containing protein [Penicillium macrosclerotiorum]|uniref:fungal-specific transcription factor domain-containing protein n=1 Tax=Penicillium macrosclerotiorum TaxID=303699 RepID=UPI002547C92D|nr:fungal-specific transcription factor domain-containing protein [Penicillium macrosclerotiorum]KAJ5675943.1 fungal-specific transcription factor domain-containing protein [Penicillium macrosclerotiorum]
MALSRKSKPRAQRNIGAEKADEVQSLRAEVWRLKTQLGQNRGQNQAPNPIQGLDKTTRAAHVEDQHEDDDHMIGSMELPQLQEAMTLVGIFLNTHNSVLPLFHSDTLLRLVGECYAHQPRQRDPVVWAAVNVVFALASQHVSQSTSNVRSQYQENQTMEYLNKAKSIISTVMLSETRLLNIQVLVGMVMVLQTAHNLTPSLILISATMRLAHKLGLHSHTASAHLDLVQRRQHARVFWLAYILDKDLSLRTQQPSVQRDDDIDVELPSSLPTSNDDNDNTAGIVVTADGNARVNYFLARVKLANIEGRIYDSLYSTRAVNRSLEERGNAKENIISALDEWRASIPPEFSASIVISSIRNKPANGGFFCVLHSISLQCMALVNRADAWDGQWVSGVRDHSRGIQIMQLPPAWETIVHQARNYMLLFREMWSKDAWFRWLVVTHHIENTIIDGNRMTSCPYTTAIVLLTANTLYNSRHYKIQHDIELVDSALLWLKEAVRENPSEEAQALQETCVEAARTVKQRLAEGITTPLSNYWLLNHPDNLELS